jgi:hypothetical protein
MIASDKIERRRATRSPRHATPAAPVQQIRVASSAARLRSRGPTGDSRRLADTDAWRDSAPVLITYVLAVQPVLAPGRQEVAGAFARVLPCEVRPG